MTRIAVTALGTIAPAAISPIDRFDTSGLGVHNAALVRDFKPRDYIAPMKMRRMNQLSRLTVAAARIALGERKLPIGSGVAIGTAFGTVQTSVDYMQEYVAKGAALAPPQLFAESVANAPGSHVAIEHDLRGFNVTVTQRESSALAAAMYACAQIAKGAAPAAPGALRAARAGLPAGGGGAGPRRGGVAAGGAARVLQRLRHRARYDG